MRDYARRETAALLHKLAGALHVAGRKADAAAIHDVRVAMRRLSRCLRVFAPFYPDSYWKKIRHRMSTLMAAGAVRDCDIAMELLARAGVSRRAAVMAHLAAERHKTGKEFLEEIRRWNHHGFPHKWKSRLEL
jgi:CHAD domain-containing protein